MKESNIVLYETDDGKINIDVILKDETIGLHKKVWQNYLILVLTISMFI